MKGKLVVMVGFVMILMMVSPLSYAHQPVKKNSVELGDFNISFSGGKASIYSNGLNYKQHWELYQLNEGQLSRIQFKVQKIIRKNNTMQNTVGLEFLGQGFVVGEIYSLSGNGLDMSMSIQNNNSNNRTIVAIYSITEPHSNHILENGFINYNLNTNALGVYDKVVPINSRAWEIGDTTSQLSWKTQYPIFEAGLLNSSILGNKIALSFGPVTISGNSSYFIDPVLRPMMVICACGGGGGGGPLPITINSVEYEYTDSSTVTTFSAYTPITVKAQIGSMGGYSSATIDFYIVTRGYGLTFIGSRAIYGVGTASITWSSQPGSYLGFAASSPQGDTTVYSSFPAYPINIFTAMPITYGNNQISNPPDTYTHYQVFTPGQTYIGDLVEQVASGPNTSEPQSASNFMTFTTGFGQPSKQYYLVSAYEQKFYWAGDSIGDSSSLDMLDANFNSASWQAVSNGSWGTQPYAESLYYAMAAAFASNPDTVPVAIAMAAFGPIFFQSPGPYSEGTGTNTIYAGGNASSALFGDNGYTYLNDQYGPWYWPSYKPVYLFSFQAQIGFKYGPGSNYNSNNAVLEYLGYTSHYYIEAAYPYDTSSSYPTMGFTIFEPIGMAVS